MTFFTKEKFAEARRINDERLRQLQRGIIRLTNGAGSHNGKLPSNNEICIMEATAYILGYDRINDNPPCTSDTIRSFMIDINDRVSDRKRSKLKGLIPDIINTAPFKQYADGQFRTLYADPDYKKAEVIRDHMLADFKNMLPKEGRLDKKDFDQYGYDDREINWDRVSMKKIIPFVRELAAVAKFDKQEATPVPAE